MAYTQAWNESTPVGSAAANTMDTIVQGVKTSLRERLEQCIPGFGDDTIDPKFIVLQAGLASARPVADLFPGQGYFATDSAVLSLYDGTDWQDFNITADIVSPAAVILTGVIADRPAAGDVDVGSMFWATDTSSLYIQVADEWTLIASGSASISIFAASWTSGSFTGTFGLARIIPILIVDTTDASGDVVLDLSALASGMAGFSTGRTLIGTPVFTGSPTTPGLAKIQAIDIPGGTLTFRFYSLTEGTPNVWAAVNAQAIELTAYLAFTS